MKEHKVGYSLSGNGVAYFDPEDGILVEKEQTITWTMLYERLRRLKDGTLAWVTTEDEQNSVKISVSLEGD